MGKVIIILLVFAVACIEGCKPEVAITNHEPDSIKSNLSELHKRNRGKEKSGLSEEFDLYVDYSDCVASLVRKGEKDNYFDNNIDLFTQCDKYFKVKRDTIEESINLLDAEDVYRSLREIDVNEKVYVDILGAVQKIVDSDRQAIFVTDCQYFVKSHGGKYSEVLDHGYLADSFIKWIEKGNDIYIYYEPIDGTGRNRYYLVFTNHDIEDNINDQFYQNSGSTVSFLRLSPTDFNCVIKRDGEYEPQVNEILSLNKDVYFYSDDYEYHEYQVEWSDMMEHIKYAKDPETGEDIKGGDYIFKGLIVNDDNLLYKKIKTVDIKVYNVFEDYRAIEDSLYVKDKNVREAIKEIFDYDASVFDDNREIVVKFHENFVGKGLNTHKEKKYNLFRIDFVIDKVDDDMKTYLDDLKDDLVWSGKNGENRSLYRSVGALLKSDAFSPKSKNNGVLYTIYMYTFPSNL